MPYLARIPGGLDAALLPFRVDRLRRLPITYGPLSKRPVPREVMDRWFGPIREQREVRRDLRKYVRSAPQGRRDLLAAMDALAAFDRPALVAWASELLHADPGGPARQARHAHAGVSGTRAGHGMTTQG